VLVVMMGLPGTGKSAIASAIAKSIRAPIFSVDPIEATLIQAGIRREQRSGYAAYDLALMLARSQLELGQSAVIDAANYIEIARAWWRDLAAEFAVSRVLIECVCSDPAVHRQRIESRQRNIPGFIYEPSWDDVQQLRTEYVACTEERLVLDAVDDLEANRQAAIDYAARCL
jgi:predicted kinase